MEAIRSKDVLVTDEVIHNSCYYCSNDLFVFLGCLLEVDGVRLGTKRPTARTECMERTGERKT